MTAVRNDVAATYCQGDGSGGTGDTFIDVTLEGNTTIEGNITTTVNTLVTNVVDTGSYYNLRSISADTTFTFSGTPAAPVSWFGLSVRNTDNNPHILTFPSSFSQQSQALRTTCPIAALGELWLLWAWDGTEYQIFGDSAYFNRYTATVAPAVTDDVADGYGPGSLWYNTVSGSLYVNKSNAAGAAQWGLVGSNIQPPSASGNFIISGGGISYNAGTLSVDVAPAVYQIQGVVYNSPLTTLTATTADPTNPRIDVVAFNTSGAAVLIAGTAAASPIKPDVDPTTQVEDTFFLVAAAATTLAVTVEDIYHENVEWTTSRVGTTFVLNSTNNPHTGTTCIEATLALSAASFRFLKPAAGTYNLAEIETLSFYVRSKATWAATRFISLTVGVGNTQFGTPVNFGEGSFGFNSSLTGVYQLIVIPVNLFGANGLALTRLWATVGGSGAGIGAYFDDFEFQTGLGTGPATDDRAMHWRGNYLAAALYKVNDVVLGADGIQYVSIQPGSNHTPASSPTFWQPSTALASFTQSLVRNAQTGTTYTVLTTDRFKHLTLSNAASIAVTVPQAGASFPDGWAVLVENIGVGAATFTPTTSTINGAASMVLQTGLAAIITSDGTNYRAVIVERQGITVNAQTGTTYTVLSGDRRKLITHSNAAAVAVTLPQATGAFGAGWSCYVENRGAGAVTYTPTTSTIDGAASLAITQNQGFFLVSDGTNWYTMRGVGGAAGAAGTKTWKIFTSIDTQPPVTNYATLTTRNTLLLAELDAAAEETFTLDGKVPEGASFASGIKVIIAWYGATATSGDVVLGAAWERGNTDIDTDSFDTETTATATTNGTSGILTYTTITCTAIDSLVIGDCYRLKIARKAAAGGDTMAGYCQIRSVEVQAV